MGSSRRSRHCSVLHSCTVMLVCDSREERHQYSIHGQLSTASISDAPPLGLASVGGSLLQGGERILVIALELANTTKGPVIA